MEDIMKVLVAVNFNGTVIFNGMPVQEVCLDRNEACEHSILITTNTGAVVKFVSAHHHCKIDGLRYVWRAKVVSAKERIKIIECDPCDYEDSDWVEFFGKFTHIAASVPVEVK
jgi:hypothetical protein